MPSANMFLPCRGSATSLRHSTSIGISITRKPAATRSATVSAYDAAIAGSPSSRHMLSSKIVAPGLNSPARTRPSSTCSLNATTRSVSSPPFVTRPRPILIRTPLAPWMLRAGGWISAGMISTVQIPLPSFAAIAPSDWPHRCAPSPESLTTSTMCSLIVAAALALKLFMVSLRGHARVVVFADVDAELLPDAAGALGQVDDVGIAQPEVRLHLPRRIAPGAHRLDHGRCAGDRSEEHTSELQS